MKEKKPIFNLTNIGLFYKPLRTVWISTVRIEIDGLQVNLDCYGTEGKGMMVVCSKSFNGLTEIVEAWSF